MLASQITNVKCPACTGPLRYDSESGGLQCDYCGSSYSVKEIEALYADKDAAAQAAMQAAIAAAESASEEEKAEQQQYETSNADWGVDADKLRVYNCPSCGAQLFCEETTAATSCPYCGNNTIIPGKVSGLLKPDYVIPFKLNKDAAVDALKRFYGGKKLLPKNFSEQNHIEEIKGVYVPFWLYDVDADADMTFSGTRVNAYVLGDERITETDHFNIRRAGTVSFEKIPADASSKMPDTHMDAIEPYDYSELVPFSTAYLPGFLADKYDMSSDQCKVRIEKRAANSATDLIRQDVTGYATCNTTGSRVNIRRKKVSYVLLPVWMLTTRWNGKNYMFAMNGQTGKLIGDLPVSMGRYWAWFAGISLPLMAVLAGILYFGGMI